jgi:hypothetical protein
MDAERVRAQLDRILAGAFFVDAERASSFLRFVVECALAGRISEIKESVIAVEVLGRNPSFDRDPIRSFGSRPDACETASVLITKNKGKRTLL